MPKSNSVYEKVCFTIDGPSKKLVFNVCLFPFSKFQMVIVKNQVLIKFCYVTNIFDLHIFDNELAALLKYFEICREMNFFSLLFSE